MDKKSMLVAVLMTCAVIAIFSVVLCAQGEAGYTSEDFNVVASTATDGNGNTYSVENNVLKISKGSGTGVLGPFSNTDSVKNMELDSFASVKIEDGITEIGD